MIWIFLQYCNTSNASNVRLPRINDEQLTAPNREGSHERLSDRKTKFQTLLARTVKGSPKSESKTLKSRGFTQKQNANTVRPGKDLRNDLSIVQVISITPWKKITTKTPSTSRHRATQRNLPFEIPYIKILLA